MNKIEEPNIPEAELAQLVRLINDARWQTAKAVNYPPELMHQYTMLHFDEESRQACYRLFKAIDDYGFDDDFFGQPHRYLIIGEYKYWHYETIVNREVKNLFELRLQLRDQKKAAKEAAKAEKAAALAEEEAKRPKQPELL